MAMIDTFQSPLQFTPGMPCTHKKTGRKGVVVSVGRTPCQAHRIVHLRGEDGEAFSEYPRHLLPDKPSDRPSVEDIVQGHKQFFDELVRHAEHCEACAWGLKWGGPYRCLYGKQLRNELYDLGDAYRTHDALRRELGRGEHDAD